jgi:hypothetical protein
MNNRIRQVEVRDRSAVPAEAEVWITVVPEQVMPTTEVRGRLMGPRCPYASTVEIAYPLRPLPRPGAAGAGLVRRVVIPEASLWDPESPFLYQGPVELWQDGQRCEQVTVSHGLRTISLGPRGLRWNGRPLALRGREVVSSPEGGCPVLLPEEEALALRRGGCNLLVAPAGPATAPLWDLADRLGFVMLGRVPEASEPTLRLLEALNAHPCCLGWLVPPPGELRGRLPADFRVGVELRGEPAPSVPAGVSFVVCAADRPAEELPPDLPLLARV